MVRKSRVPTGDNLTSEIRAKGGRNSSRKGIRNKSTIEIKEKLEKLNVDVVEFLALTVKDKIEDKTHPFLDQFLAVKKNRKDKLPTPKQWEELCKAADDALEDFHIMIPFEQRQKAATDLLPYLYPKLKQIELNGDIKIKVPGINLKRAEPIVINPPLENKK